MTSKLGLYLNRRSSFFSIVRSQEFTYTVSQSFLTSTTFHVVNPLNHCANGDKVSVRLLVSAVLGLDDEEILASLTKGFFGGWIFAIEGWVMRVCGGILPAAYAGVWPLRVVSRNFGSGCSTDMVVSLQRQTLETDYMEKLRYPREQTSSHRRHALRLCTRF